MRMCERCEGAGMTMWDVFVDGLANLIGGLVGGSTVGRYCKRCKGTGLDPGEASE